MVTRRARPAPPRRHRSRPHARRPYAASARTGTPRSWAPPSWPPRAPGCRCASRGCAACAGGVGAVGAAAARRAGRPRGALARHRDRARAHLLDPAVAPFHGCLPMALPAVGAATLTVGRSDRRTGGGGRGRGAVGGRNAHRPGRGGRDPVSDGPAAPDRPRGRLPGVAAAGRGPMVSAAPGPPLVPHLPPGQGREALLLGCLALAGLSLLATFLMLPLIFARLVRHGPLPRR